MNVDDLARKMLKGALHPPGARRYPNDAKAALRAEIEELAARFEESGVTLDPNPDEAARFWEWWNVFKQTHMTRRR